MLASTLLAVFFVPVFYVVFQRFSEWLSPRQAEAESDAEALSPPAAAAA
jgi:hydrophobic/amphiphilic exporter-1 (mainly G- bacteria), HAE1 family